MNFDFRSPVALVTGAASGLTLSRASSRRFRLVLTHSHIHTLAHPLRPREQGPRAKGQGQGGFAWTSRAIQVSILSLLDCWHGVLVRRSGMLGS